VFLANIHRFGDLPKYEIGEVKLFDDLPDNLTYPEVHSMLHQKVSIYCSTLP
jgi:8-oxo-dGTP diphosphatase